MIDLDHQDDDLTVLARKEEVMQSLREAQERRARQPSRDRAGKWSK
jgi:hypothetical protein